MTAGGRSNSSGAGVSSLVSGSGVNDGIIKVHHHIDTVMKVNQNYDSKI